MQTHDPFHHLQLLNNTHSTHTLYHGKYIVFQKTFENLFISWWYKNDLTDCMPGFTLSSWTRVYPFNLSICWTNGLNIFTGSIITVIVMATKLVCVCVFQLKLFYQMYELNHHHQLWFVLLTKILDLISSLMISMFVKRNSFSVNCHYVIIVSK